MKRENINFKKHKISEKLLEWQKNNYQDYPWRVRSSYKILVATFMLHKTSAKQVVPVYEKFIKEYPSLEYLEGIKKKYLHIKFRPLGLYRRVDMFYNAINEIFFYYEGRIPTEREELISLTGVGNYKANAILCFGQGKSYPIVDVNTAKVISRLIGFRYTDPPGRDKNLYEIYRLILPDKKTAKFNYAVLDLSHLLCKKKDPLCIECPVKMICEYDKR